MKNKNIEFRHWYEYDDDDDEILEQHKKKIIMIFRKAKGKKSFPSKQDVIGNSVGSFIFILNFYIFLLVSLQDFVLW